MNNISHIASDCTGCTSCMNSCPREAIKMLPDNVGFYYPYINTDLCIDCGKCVKACPVAGSDDVIDNRIRAYYGASQNIDVVSKSSSGGAFSVMAEYVLEKNGLVCGAAMNYETMELEYKSSDNSNLDSLRRSKYIASNPHTIFKEVKTELNKDRLVLFCGLACHIDGLKKFLNKEYLNLITCDLICGGTASPLYFREHIRVLEKKYGSKVVDVNFRAKLYGWKEHSLKISFANRKEYATSAFFDSFFKGYFEKPYQRDSCYKCKYRLAHRSDIIIADYWAGLKKGRGNNEGVSMVITNSKQGDEFWLNVLKTQNHNFLEMPIEDSNYVFKKEEERYNKAFSTKREFMCLYEKYGFEKAARMTYFKGIFIAKLKRLLYNIKKQIL